MVVSNTNTAINVTILHSKPLFKILVIAHMAVTGALIKSCKPIDISI